MAISVVCSTCQARFKVSDKFAGQTGPCPKCKNPIKIPKASSDVTIHDPTEAAASSNVGHMPTTPIVFKQESFSRITLTLVFSAGVLLFLAAYVAGRIFEVEPLPSIDFPLDLTTEDATQTGEQSLNSLDAAGEQREDRQVVAVERQVEDKPKT